MEVAISSGEDNLMELKVGFPADMSSFSFSPNHNLPHYPMIHISMYHRITAGRRRSTALSQPFIGEAVVYEDDKSFYIHPSMLASHTSAYSSLLHVMEQLQVQPRFHLAIVTNIVDFIRMKVFHLLHAQMVVPVVVKINLMLFIEALAGVDAPLYVLVPELRPIMGCLEKTVVNFEGEDCAVCLEKMEVGTEIIKLPCRHIFHGECIDKWLPAHHTCPLCRLSLPTSPLCIV